MRFKLSSAWSVGADVVPTGTIIDFAKSDRWSKLAKGKTIPLNATPLDQEAHEAQQRAYPDHRYLLSGSWS
jgi:hypothetical protein